MADNPGTPTPQQSEPVIIDGATTAPIIYFEAIPTLGNNNGVISLMLAAGIVHPLTEGVGTVTRPKVVAHLRCSIASAMHLRDTIDRALLLGAPTEGQAN